MFHSNESALGKANKTAPAEQELKQLRKVVKAMYTDYGYLIDGIEYATVDEAYDSDEDE